MVKKMYTIPMRFLHAGDEMAKNDVEYKPLVSIIIPTYNEKNDVRFSLNSAIGFEYPNKEIIVVDDSTDETPEIIKEYEKYGVRLVRRASRANGCCGARNLGILEAKGEIVVLLNADVFPPKNFLDRILIHYKDGADYLLVWQKVANDKHLFPRFIEAESSISYDGQDWIEWTEGFSCRKEAAVDVGMIPGDFPFPFCRDWVLGKKLGEKYKKVIDRSIVVPHIAPHTFKDFWRMKKNRGRFAFLFNYFIGSVSMKKLMNGKPFEQLITKYSLSILTLRTVAKTVRDSIEIGLVFPVLRKCIKIAKFSPRGLKDVPLFSLTDIIQRAAFTAGEWGALWDIVRLKMR
jgi:glycosyltransferase involved in cell wall biosynthesis